MSHSFKIRANVDVKIWQQEVEALSSVGRPFSLYWSCPVDIIRNEDGVAYLRYNSSLSQSGYVAIHVPSHLRGARAAFPESDTSTTTENDTTVSSNHDGHDDPGPAQVNPSEADTVILPSSDDDSPVEVDAAPNTANRLRLDASTPISSPTGPASLSLSEFIASGSNGSLNRSAQSQAASGFIGLEEKSTPLEAMAARPKGDIQLLVPYFPEIANLSQEEKENFVHDKIKGMKPFLFFQDGQLYSSDDPSTPLEGPVPMGVDIDIIAAHEPRVMPFSMPLCTLAPVKTSAQLQKERLRRLQDCLDEREREQTMRKTLRERRKELKSLASKVPYAKSSVPPVILEICKELTVQDEEDAAIQEEEEKREKAEREAFAEKYNLTAKEIEEWEARRQLQEQRLVKRQLELLARQQKLEEAGLSSPAAVAPTLLKPLYKYLSRVHHEDQMTTEEQERATEEILDKYGEALRYIRKKFGEEGIVCEKAVWKGEIKNEDHLLDGGMLFRRTTPTSLWFKPSPTYFEICQNVPSSDPEADESANKKFWIYVDNPAPTEEDKIHFRNLLDERIFRRQMMKVRDESRRISSTIEAVDKETRPQITLPLLDPRFADELGFEPLLKPDVEHTLELSKQAVSGTFDIILRRKHYKTFPIEPEQEFWSEDDKCPFKVTCPGKIEYRPIATPKGGDIVHHGARIIIENTNNVRFAYKMMDGLLTSKGKNLKTGVSRHLELLFLHPESGRILASAGFAAATNDKPEEEGIRDQEESAEDLGPAVRPADGGNTTGAEMADNAPTTSNTSSVTKVVAMGDALTATLLISKGTEPANVPQADMAQPEINPDAEKQKEAKQAVEASPPSVSLLVAQAHSLIGSLQPPTRTKTFVKTTVSAATPARTTGLGSARTAATPPVQPKIKTVTKPPPLKLSKTAPASGPKSPQDKSPQDKSPSLLDRLRPRKS